MAYTVKALAKLSGVSARTLRFYDAIGLLPPAYVGENGYRYYEAPQLHALQQILFFRELGFPLEEIRTLLPRAEADRIRALRAHREALEKNVVQTQELIRTIDKTIARLQGEGTMKDQELFQGFDKTKQEGYEQQLVGAYGDEARRHIAESKRRTKDWSKEDWQRVGQDFSAKLAPLVEQLRRGVVASAPEVQGLVAEHHRWLTQFWTPTRESYAGLGRLYATAPDFRKVFDPHHPRLADFLAEAMEVFSRSLPQK